MRSLHIWSSISSWKIKTEFIFCSSIVCSAHITYASRRLLLSKKNQFLVRWKRKAIYMELLIYSTLSCGGEVQTKKRLFGKEINTSWAGPGSANLMSSGLWWGTTSAKRWAICDFLYRTLDRIWPKCILLSLSPFNQFIKQNEI